MQRRWITYLKGFKEILISIGMRKHNHKKCELLNLRTATTIWMNLANKHTKNNIFGGKRQKLTEDSQVCGVYLTSH